MSRIKKKLSSKIIITGLYDFLRRFRPQFAAQRNLILLSLLTLILSIFARILEPWPLKYIFDSILVPTNDVQTIPLINRFVDQGTAISTETLLFVLVIAIIIFTAVRTILSYTATVGMALAATRTMSVVRSLLFSHLQKLSLTFHQKSKAGDLLTRFTQDIDRLRDVASLALLPLVANILTVITMAGVMIWINLELALIVVAVIPFFFLTTLRFSGKIHSVVRDQRKNDGAMAASAAESIGAIKLVQALSLNKILEKTFSKQNNKSLKKGAQAQRLSAMLERNIDLLLAIATALVLWRGVNLVLEATITVGTLMVFITYLAQIFRPMRQTSKYLIKISKALASSERIAHIFDTLPEITDRKNAISASNVKGSLDFENVSFSFNKHKHTLKNIDISIAAGEHVAFVGPSGAGKSTILSLALRLYDPQQGKILLDGHDLRDYKLDSFRSQISLVLQDSILFGISIRDNIGYGQLDASDDDIEVASRLANAHEFISSLPDGYNTILAEKGETLSGGQRQRIALARAVIRKASIMILDEPTSNLDNVNEMGVISALEQCTKNKTTILVSHNIQAVTSFDRIYYIQDGQIYESGTHEELVANHGAYWKQFIQKADFQGENVKNQGEKVKNKNIPVAGAA